MFRPAPCPENRVRYTFEQVEDSLEVDLRCYFRCEKRLCILQRTGNQFQLLMRLVASVRVASNHVPLNGVQHMAESVSKRTVGTRLESQSSGSPASCMKYRSLCTSDSVTNGSIIPRR